MAVEVPQSISIYDRFPYLKPIEEKGGLPHHVAIIMDGNRTWARKEFGEDVQPIQGHIKGMNNIINILRDLRELKTIKYVTLWAFSTENWQRDPEEVDDLMKLFATAIPAILPEIGSNNGRFIHLGRKDRIPQEVRDALDTAETQTAKNTGQVVCLGIDYGAVDQEIRVSKKIMGMIRSGDLPPEIEVDEELRKSLLDTRLNDGSDIPPIDLVFRTSGQQRLSGLPNAEYAELCKIMLCLPDATTGDFVNGLVNYADRTRRMGK